MLAGYEKEQAALALAIQASIQAELDSFDADSVRADKFIGVVKKFTGFSELTTPMINEFVEKIIVHKADRSSGERVQQVDIYLNFIGKIEVPVSEPTPEEIAAMENLRIRRRKSAGRISGTLKNASAKWPRHNKNMTAKQYMRYNRVKELISGNRKSMPRTRPYTGSTNSRNRIDVMTFTNPTAPSLRYMKPPRNISRRI